MVFQWIAKKTDGWASGIQEKEILVVTKMLEGMALDEIGVVVASVTDRRSFFNAKMDWDFLEPVALLQKVPTVGVQLNKLVRMHQNNKNFAEAAAISILLHTVRSANDPRLRLHGRTMWKILATGFPFVVQAAEDFAATNNFQKHLRIEGFREIPSSLEPKES
jgi:hypothetical protein